MREKHCSVFSPLCVSGRLSGFSLPCGSVPPGHSHSLPDGPRRHRAPALCPAGSEGDPAPERRAATAEYVQGPSARPLSPAEAWSLPTVQVSVAALSPRLSVQCPFSPVVLLEVCLGRAEALVLTDFRVMEAAPSWLLLRTEYRWDPFVEWFKKHVKDST